MYLDVQGCLTFFIVSDGVSRTKLREVIDQKGWVCRYPRSREPMSALKRSIHETLKVHAWPMQSGKNRLLVRPLARRSGYALVEEIPMMGDRVDHQQVGTIKLCKNPDGTMAPDCSSSCDMNFVNFLSTQFSIHLDLVSRSSLSDVLVSLMEKMFDATSLRPGGGLYQFQEHNYQNWLDITQTIKDCTVQGRKAPEIYVLKHDMDDNAAAAIISGVRRQVQTRVKELKDEIFSGRLKSRGVEKRRQEAVSLNKKVSDIEKLFSSSLPELHELLDEITTCQGGLTVLEAVPS